MRLRWRAGILSRAVRRAGGVARRQIRVFVSRDRDETAAMDREHNDDMLDHAAPSIHDELEETAATPRESESVPSEPRVHFAYVLIIFIVPRP